MRLFSRILKVVLKLIIYVFGNTLFFSEIPEKYNNGVNNNGFHQEPSPMKQNQPHEKIRMEQFKSPKSHPSPKPMDHISRYGNHRVSPDWNDRPESTDSIGSVSSDRMFKRTGLENYKRGSPRSPSDITLISQPRNVTSLNSI